MNTALTHVKLLRNIARFAAGLVLIAALVKFVLTFSLSAAAAIGIGTFALICLAREDIGLTKPGDVVAEQPAARSRLLGGLARMLRFKDHDPG